MKGNVKASDLASLLEGYRFSCAGEAELQTAVADVLTKNGVPFEREARIGKGERIDFLVGGVGLEIKVEGSVTAIARQLQRYAMAPDVSELLLATTRVAHTVTLGNLGRLMGKPVHVARLRGGLF